MRAVNDGFNLLRVQEPKWCGRGTSSRLSMVEQCKALRTLPLAIMAPAIEGMPAAQ
jgi:hypothetical protein